MKPKLYLDTSIPSAYFDYSKPIRQLITQKWFENEASKYELYISVITIEEIERLLNISKRDKIKSLILEYNPKILKLSKVESLAPWNFKHIVSLNPIKKNS